MGDSIPGFRFYPTEEELISFYLKSKLEREGIREELMDLVIPVLNIYDFSPSDLQQYSGVKCRGDPEQCFFFIPRQESETRGGRPSRLTETGYWKATGSRSFVFSSDNRIIGAKQTMVFYTGRAPHGSKTQWKMNEYKAFQGEASPSSLLSAIPTHLRHEYSLCRVYKRTKCVRAFDRRPTGIFPRSMDSHHMNIAYDHHHHHHHDQDHAPEASMGSSSSTHPPTAAEKTSSHDGSTPSSSPEDLHGGGSGQEAGDEAFWLDWDNALNSMVEEK